jgi:hypothetical protein
MPRLTRSQKIAREIRNLRQIDNNQSVKGEIVGPSEQSEGISTQDMKKIISVTAFLLSVLALFFTLIARGYIS